jgi:hypothetical protein
MGLRCLSYGSYAATSYVSNVVTIFCSNRVFQCAQVQPLSTVCKFLVCFNLEEARVWLTCQLMLTEYSQRHWVSLGKSGRHDAT